MREKNQDFGHNERPRCREKTQKASFEPLVALRPETILRSREPSRLRVRMGGNAGCMQSQFLNVLSSVPALDRGGQRRMRYIDTAKRPIDGNILSVRPANNVAPPNARAGHNHHIELLEAQFQPKSIHSSKANWMATMNSFKLRNQTATTLNWTTNKTFPTR